MSVNFVQVSAYENDTYRRTDYIVWVHGEKVHEANCIEDKSSNEHRWTLDGQHLPIGACILRTITRLALARWEREEVTE